jgi:hypothetical protein
MANWVSLGKVVVPSPGEPVNATINVKPSAEWGINQKYYASMAIFFQVSTENQGLVYVGTGEDFNKTTGVGLLATLGVPTTSFIPSVSVNVPNSPAGLSATDYSIDADLPGEGVIVSVLAP